MAKKNAKKAARASKHAQIEQVSSIHKATTAIVALLLLVAGALFYFGTARFQSDLEQERSELSRVEATLRQVESDIAAVQEGSSSSLRALYDRVVFIDSQLPAANDVVSLASWLSAAAPGVDIGGIAPAGEVAQGNLTGQQMSVQISGPAPAIRNWLTTVQTAPGRLITVSDVTLTAGETSWNMTATVTAWASPADRLTSEASVNDQLDAGPLPGLPEDPAAGIDPAPGSDQPADAGTEPGGEQGGESVSRLDDLSDELGSDASG